MTYNAKIQTPIKFVNIKSPIKEITEAESPVKDAEPTIQKEEPPV